MRPRSRCSTPRTCPASPAPWRTAAPGRSATGGSRPPRHRWRPQDDRLPSDTGRGRRPRRELAPGAVHVPSWLTAEQQRWAG
ncbi:MAG TPA: hypothetical protein DHU96_30390 [Actinobacteria bacterium]|nr:hypothetical protein [Actinomycetota bacterium]